MAGVCVLFTLLVALYIQRGLGETDLPLLYNLEEENPPNTFVGNITKDARLDETLTRQELNQLRFSFTAARGLYRQYFTIQSRTGILATIRSIDREEVCPGELECQFNMAVMVQPYEFFRVIKIAVNIMDMNDHSPHFQSDRQALEISENKIPGDVFNIPIAEDLDSGTYGVQEYRLESAEDEGEEGKFELRVTDSGDGIEDVRLVLTGSLDKERVDHYDLVITARDGGTPPRTGSMVLEVTVLDANDNNPQFDNDTYTVVVSENTAPGTIITRIHATDLDDGPNGEIMYSFSEATKALFGEIFELNSRTGDILVRGTIDYEITEEYQLNVMAHDHGVDSLPAHAKVIVKVKDLNDHAPIITVNTLTESGNPEVLETSPVGTFVAHIVGTDPDSGASGDVVCFISDMFFMLEHHSGGTYTLKTAAVFDRELRSEYPVTIECRDSDADPQVTRETLFVRVMDINDHSPMFWDAPYFAEIRENNVPGMYLLQVNATDRDSGRNSAIKFSVKDENELITINPISGVIRAKAEFDYEREQMLEFVIIAQDQGSKPNSASATFSLMVLDTNDEAPQFSQDDYEFYVFENQPAGTEVGIVVAIDADTPPYNEITYSLTGGHEVTAAFKINPETGEIYTKASLDREHYSVFQFLVIASNLGYHNLQTVANVTVNVVDQNDNSPVFVFPSLSNNTIEISSNVEVGALLTTISAKDSDNDVNAILTYQFEVENSTFLLNETTGEVRLGSELSEAPDQVFRFVIIAIDHGSPQHRTHAELVIFVNRRIALASVETHSVIGFLKSHLFLIIICTVAILLVVFMILVAIVCTVRRRNDKGDKSGVKQYPMVTANSTEKIPMEGLRCSPERTPSPPPPPPPDGSLSTVEDLKLKKGVTFQMETGESCTDDKMGWQERLEATVIEVHEMLRILQADRDSETGSNTDSGRGGSEEGDHGHQSPGIHDSHRGKSLDGGYHRGMLKGDYRGRHLVSRPSHLYPVTEGFSSQHLPLNRFAPKSRLVGDEGTVLPPGVASPAFSDYDKPYQFIPGKGWDSSHSYSNVDNYYDPRYRVGVMGEKEPKYYSYSPPKGSTPAELKLPPRYPSDSIHECSSPELRAKYSSVHHPAYNTSQDLPPPPPPVTKDLHNHGNYNENQCMPLPPPPAADDDVDIDSLKRRQPYSSSRQNRSDFEKLADGTKNKGNDRPCLRTFNKVIEENANCESGISDTSDTCSMDSQQYFSGEQMVV